MSLKPRCVFDTNVIVSAVLFEHSQPGLAFYTALDRAQIVLSDDVFAELSRVLSRKKFDRYLAADERELFLVKLLQTATLVQITETIRECRDPNDDKFLELIVSASASFLVTGDQDLLALHPFRGISILTPAQFLEVLAEA